MTITRRDLSRLILSGALFAGATPLLAAIPSAANCADLAGMQIANTTISEAIDVPAGNPLSVGSGFGPPVVVTSLPAHCLVHGEVNQHKGANGKYYGDKFEIRMPVEWQGRFLFLGGGGLDGALNPAIALQGPVTKPDSKSALSLGYALVSTDGGHQEANPRALDEAKWGLDWSLRMRFAPGIRLKKNFTSYWTDSRIGTDDDVVQVDAGYDLRETIYALVALSTAARVLKKTEPALAASALKAAQEDYAEIRPHVNAPLTPVTYGDSGRGSWRDLAAYLALSAAEFFRATANPAYRTDAILFGKWLTDLQEQRFLDGSPVTGFFYADAERTQIQREVWGGSDDSGWLALQTLCEEFPEQLDWINWYAALLIYSEYYCREGSMASSPFQVIPTTVWRRKDIETDLRPDLIGGAMAVHASPMFPTPPTDEGTHEQRLAMYEAGTPLTPDMRLRVFPIWYNHVQHGSTTAHLCSAAGLGGAAQVRGSLELCELAMQQLQWVVGANPFSRSLIFGIGYDYWQNFTVDNVNFVGGLGLGMNSYEADAPAWPNNAVFPYKEQWSYSSSRIAINLAQCAVPARITGRTVGPTTLRDLRTGKTTPLTAGSFDRTLPPGLYTASSDEFEWQLELVGGRTYQLSLDPRQAVDLSLKAVADDTNTVTVEAKLRGSGVQPIALKLFNLEAPETTKQVTLQHGEDAVLQWKLKVLNANKPWIAVAIPQSAPDLRKEVFGRIGNYARIG